jgi:uncharacterized Zn-binding protein involved in type VI secretion
MPKICREGDPLDTGHLCDAKTKLATPGQSTVRANGILIARKGDLTISHDILVGIVCVPHTAAITGSSSTVRVSGKFVARVGDAVDSGKMTDGSPNVFAG